MNASAEEAVHRGYALSRLSGVWPRTLAIAACSVFIGLQHAFFAPTVDAMIVYVVAFTVGGHRLITDRSKTEAAHAHRDFTLCGESDDGLPRRHFSCLAVGGRRAVVKSSLRIQDSTRSQLLS